jgi:MFS family permease
MIPSMSRDRGLLYTASFLRSARTGAVGILIALYLAKIGLTPEEIGVVIGCGLAGNALAALLATYEGDRLGRRRFLAAMAILMGGGGLAVAFTSHPVILALAAFVGLINGNGRERGAPLILEQAMVPALADDESRTRVFSYFNVAGDFGHGVGAALAMLPDALERWCGFDQVLALRTVLMIAAFLSLATAPLSSVMSKVVEPEHAERPAPLAPESRRLLTRISALFFVDALGGGFITTAWLAYYFSTHFHVTPFVIGALFLGARLANAVSHVAAAWIAQRIGLLKTMVATSLPASFLLLAVVGSPDTAFAVAATLFLLREGLAQMDVPTRQSYVMAIVRPEERTRASGFTNLTRMTAWAIAPFITGWLMETWPDSPALPFVIGTALKVGYAVVFYLVCRNTLPPEEQAALAAARPVAAPI